MLLSSLQTLHRTLALLALLVLGLGLPRVLVVCTDSDGRRHVEFGVPGIGDCSSASQPAEWRLSVERLHGQPVPEQPAERLEPGDCLHTALLSELAGPPRGKIAASPLSPLAIAMAPVTVGLPPLQAVRHGLPAAAGPPRTDRTTLLRSCTVLQV